MLPSFSNRTTLVTGGLTEIGRAIALALARQGASVVVSGRSAEAGEVLVGERRGLGGDAAFIAADVRHEDEVAGLVDRAVARFGRPDIATNNAGGTAEEIAAAILFVAPMRQPT